MSTQQRQTYADRRRWSEDYTRDVLLPYLATRQDDLPFGPLRLTQDHDDWLARGIDMIAKADAIASRGGGICLVALRCQHKGDDRRFTLRWPSEYQSYRLMQSDPAVIGPAYAIQAFADAADKLLAVYVASTLRILEAVDRTWDRRRYSEPLLIHALDDHQAFHPVPYSYVADALRLLPTEQMAMF